MTDPDLNLLIALDALLSLGSVAGAARRLELSASAMSRTLSRLRAVTGDPLLVRAGRNMVLTPYAEEIRERAQNAVFEARAVLRPAVSELSLATLERTFTLRANEGFVEAFGAVLIAATAQAAPFVRLCFAPKPEKVQSICVKGWWTSRLAYWAKWGLRSAYRRYFAIVSSRWSVKVIRLNSKVKLPPSSMPLAAM